MKRKVFSVILLSLLTFANFWQASAWFLDQAWDSITSSMDQESDMQYKMTVSEKSTSITDDIIKNDWWADLSLWTDWHNVSIKDNFLKTIQTYILWIVAMVAVAMSIYIWFELATAEWNADQFKKWLKALTYLIVWLAVIPIAYIAIKIATWFTF